MIAFSCAHCGMKLQVKPEYSGRSSKCPTCKQLLTVPTLDRTQGRLPNEQIDGAPSSLDRAGVHADVTLAADAASAATGRTPVQELLTQQTKKGERYIVEGEIARGMGVVLRAVDGDIRREVAVKFMLDQADAKKKTRFVEEAQITGQLEHPNIVPIHELGVDAEKRLFFSMKMVRGRNLAQVLDELRKNPGPAEKEYSLTRLLNIMVGVCNALAYAHARGVIHRDLKPANIMLGDFGEVYVMDWGLAKVLGRKDEALAAPGLASKPVAVGRNSKVATNREAEADLTQDGAILGTPVYMPPEQALGKIGEIDHRSDVYSLGAILYEMLTLQPPVDKEGGYLAVLMRVSQGEVVGPERRSPQRTRTGKIPKELAAVAMKALAPNKEDRYSSAEALRQDVERFQEGRSVSAKADTSWELAWKLVKRNKGATLGAVATLLVLVASLVFIFQAWRATSAAQEATLKAQEEKERIQEEKRKQLVTSVPAFLGAARMWGENRNLDNALIQVNLALEYAPESPAAQLLKSQVLVARKDFADAGAELDRYLTVRPNDADAKELRQLCRQAKPDDGERLLALSGVLLRQKALGLSDCLMQDVSKLVLSREKLLPVLRSRIEASWPGLGKRLEVHNDGKLSLNLHNCGSQVRDLSPLRDMPLDELYLNACVQVRDLTPLQGMPLTKLDLGACEQLRDLTPLHDLKLTSLSLWGCVQVRDVTPLHGMPLTALTLFSCQMRDLTPLQGMPLTYLNLDSCGQVVDLTPLHGMKLTWLSLPNQVAAKDLTFLQSMPLTSLHGSFCGNLRDLAPLKGLRLKSLTLRALAAEIHDLGPLEGMPLTSLNLIYCGKVKDLSPLAGLELQEICLTPKYVTKGMDALRQMKSLKTIILDWDHTERLPAAEFWKKYDAGDFK